MCAWGRLGMLAVLCPVMAWAMGCCCAPAAPYGPADAVGTYEGDYGNGYREVVELKADGTLEQVFTKDGQEFLRSQGTWALDPKRGLVFRDVYKCYFPFDAVPYKTEFRVIRETLQPSRNVIAFSEWPNDRLTKVSKTARPSK